MALTLQSSIGGTCNCLAWSFFAYPVSALPLVELLTSRDDLMDLPSDIRILSRGPPFLPLTKRPSLCRRCFLPRDLASFTKTGEYSLGTIWPIPFRNEGILAT